MLVVSRCVWAVPRRPVVLVRCQGCRMRLLALSEPDSANLPRTCPRVQPQYFSYCVVAKFGVLAFSVAVCSFFRRAIFAAIRRCRMGPGLCGWHVVPLSNLVVATDNWITSIAVV
mmetsp:Transcript_42506/g.89999  ORF Transcript_42506/g.89999 Transcript_42506/m.89999 type:complete len:115 (-) Transcript_42506:8-352(-)